MTRARDVANIDGILTTKGDIYAATAAATPARLGVGSNGDTIVADSSTSTGLRYQGSQAAGKNLLINGAFDIWQRGTSFTADAVYTADRWIASMQTSNATISQVTSSLPTGFRNAIKVQRNSGSTSTTLTSLAQAIETINSIPLQGQTVTLSFWAKKGANFSDAAGQIFVRMYSGTGTDQSASSYGGWTGYIEWHNTSSVTPTTSWARYSITGTVPSTATEIGIRIGFGPVGTAGADDSFFITGVQLELGSVATSFARAGGTIQGELAACKRYLPSVNVSTAGVATFFGYAYATNSMIAAVPFDVQARVSPTGITVNPTLAGNYVVRNKTNGDATITSLTFDAAGVSGATVLAGATLTQGDAARLICGSGNANILFTGCEL